MSRIYDKKTSNGYKFHIEHFDSPMEVAKVNRTRQITSYKFNDMKEKHIRKTWEGVENYEQALEFMEKGYQPIVDEIRNSMKMAMKGKTEKRFSFQNNITGFAPVVPLAMMGVPNNMIDGKMKRIKAKVIDVIYDITCSAGTSPEDILKAGQTMLGVLIKLEKQGYRFNLYAMQSYSEDKSADLLIVKVKSANQMLDLKRASFPLMHPGFFRVIGFDWYSKCPGAKYRDGYGHAISYKMSTTEYTKTLKELYGNNVVGFSCKELLHRDDKYIEEAITNAKNKI